MATKDEEEDIVCTQIVNEQTMLANNDTTNITDPTVSDNNDVNPHNIWGMLRRKGGPHNAQEEIKLVYRIDSKNRKDTYTIGRNSGCDIIVRDRRISAYHCMIYCDYTQPKLRVFIEDTSANGTFINFSLKRLSKGERLELKSGDEIYLLNPRYYSNTTTLDNEEVATCFLFFNMRDRLFDKREIVAAPKSKQDDDTLDTTDRNSHTITPHIEDHYIIGDQIGAGTCGQVYLCIHRSTGKEYAVKIIDTTKFSKIAGLSVKELQDEANMMRQLNHPSIIRVQETFETDKVIFIVMELVRGGDLFDRIMLRGKYSESAARSIMKNILSAVKYLHSLDIIHRDLKPENILLSSTDDDTDVKISDFGLAKKVSTDGLKTFCGTPFYFAPEVLRRQNTVLGMGRYGTAADMWSLGVILYILLCGSFPFDEANLFDQIQYAQYSLSGNEWTGISESAKHLIRSLLTLRPEHRMTVTEALDHPWILGNSNMPTPQIINLSKKFSPDSTSKGVTSHRNGKGTPSQLSKTTSPSMDHRPAQTKVKSTPVRTPNDIERSAAAAAASKSRKNPKNDSQMKTPNDKPNGIAISAEVPIGNIFWSIRSQGQNYNAYSLSRSQSESGSILNKDNNSSKSSSQGETVQVSLFGQVMGACQKTSNIARSSSFAGSKESSKVIGSSNLLLSVKSSPVRNYQGSDSSDISPKGTNLKASTTRKRKSKTDGGVMVNEGSAIKRKKTNGPAQTSLNRNSIIYHDDSIDVDCKELSDDQIEIDSDEESKSNFHQLEINKQSKKDSENTSMIDVTNKQQLKIDKGTNSSVRKGKSHGASEKLAVNSLEKAWKLDDPSYDRITEKLEKREENTQGVSNLAEKSDVDCITPEKRDENVSHDNIRENHMIADIEPENGEGNILTHNTKREANANLRRPTSARKLRTPMKSIADLFKSKTRITSS